MPTCKREMTVIEQEQRLQLMKEFETLAARKNWFDSLPEEAKKQLQQVPTLNESAQRVKPSLKK